MRALLYDLLKRGVSLCFNTLNVLLGGNLPPFASAVAIVEEQDYYLVVELPGGRVVFPGGFMTWREDPKHTAQREAHASCHMKGDWDGKIFSCPYAAPL